MDIFQSDQLFEAARGNNVEQLRQLLTDGVHDLDESNENGETAIVIAVGAGRTTNVKLLLDHGASIQDLPVFEVAIRQGHADILELLLERISSISDETLGRFLLLAAEHKHLNVVSVLLEDGANISVADATDGNTSLHIASRNGDRSLVSFLLEKRARYDLPNKEGKTAVDIAESKAVRAVFSHYRGTTIVAVGFHLANVQHRVERLLRHIDGIPQLQQWMEERNRLLRHLETVAREVESAPHAIAQTTGVYETARRLVEDHQKLSSKLVLSERNMEKIGVRHQLLLAELREQVNVSVDEAEKEEILRLLSLLRNARPSVTALPAAAELRDERTTWLGRLAALGAGIAAYAMIGTEASVAITAALSAVGTTLSAAVTSAVVTAATTAVTALFAAPISVTFLLGMVFGAGFRLRQAAPEEAAPEQRHLSTPQESSPVAPAPTERTWLISRLKGKNVPEELIYTCERKFRDDENLANEHTFATLTSAHFNVFYLRDKGIYGDRIQKVLLSIHNEVVEKYATASTARPRERTTSRSSNADDAEIQRRLREIYNEIAMQRREYLGQQREERAQRMATVRTSASGKEGGSTAPSSSGSATERRHKGGDGPDGEGSDDCGEYCCHGPSMTLLAAERGHLPCLRYAIKHRFLIHAEACTAAARGNFVACLRLLREHNAPWSADTPYAAALYGQFEALSFVMENGCPYDDDLLLSAAKGGNVMCVQYLVEERMHLMDLAVFGAAFEHAHAECVSYLLDAGCPFQDYVFSDETEWYIYRGYHIEPDIDERFLKCILLSVGRGWGNNGSAVCPHLVGYVLNNSDTFPLCRAHIINEGW